MPLHRMCWHHVQVAGHWDKARQLMQWRTGNSWLLTRTPGPPPHPTTLYPCPQGLADMKKDPEYISRNMQVGA